MMKKLRHSIIPASYLVLEKNNQVLLIRRFNTGYQDGKYSLVAGHVDAGETFIQAIVREAKEEIGITLLSQDLIVVHVMHRKSSVDAAERMDIFIQASKWTGEIKNCEPHKCDQLRWCSYDQLPPEIIDYVAYVLKLIKSGIFYSEYGW
jgi:8-oxo-dGTP diphosphatase